METVQPTFLQRVQVKLAASRFFTFSLLLHFVIVMLAGSAVVVNSINRPPDFAAEGGGGLVLEESSADAPPPEPVQLQQQQFVPTTPQAPTTQSLDIIAVQTNTPTTFQVAKTLPMVKAAPPAEMDQDMQKIIQSALGSGMGKLPSTMAGRAGGTQRMMAMQKMGGKEKSEKAVMAGLRWLKKNQNPDGSWSKQYTPAMTGLAVLCFLGHGEIPTSPEFGPTVKMGIDWLLINGIKFQGRLSMEQKFSQTGVYQHGIAAYALGEYYTMTKDDRVKDVLTMAMAHIVQGQASDGGWQYSFAKEDRSDTSVSGWQIQALKAAHLTGLNIPGVDETLDKSMLNLKRVVGPNGGFGYRSPADERYSLTGVGVLCTYFWKGEKEKIVRDGIKFIIEKTEKDNPVKYNEATADLYAWYYHTQACLMFGGNAWTKWNKWFQGEIVNAQHPEGYWPPTGNPKPHGPENNPELTGKIYRTTLSVLMLEVFYRYMPTTKT